MQNVSYLITSGGDDDDMMTLRRLPLPDFIRSLSTVKAIKPSNVVQILARRHKMPSLTQSVYRAFYTLALAFA